MTSTPSRIAFSIAAAESESKQPSAPHTLYDAIHAPGATPEMMPRSIPSGFACTPESPAAVVEVCVPCPLLSRALSGNTSFGNCELYVSRNGWPATNLLLHTNGSTCGVNGLSPKLHGSGLP